MSCFVSVLGQGYYSFVRSFTKGLSSSEALLNYFSYFTVWTNTLMGLFLLMVLLSKKVVSAWWLGLLTYSLLFLSLVYYVLINFDPVGFERLYDFGLHVLNPTLAFVLWIFVHKKGDLRFAKVWSWSFYPLSFVGFSLIRNRIDGWAPYFFLDPKVVGVQGLGLYIIALTLVFLLGASVFLWGSNRASQKLDLRWGY